MSKIVVGVDLSSESERAVAHAVGIARQVGSELALVLIDDFPAETTLVFAAPASPSTAATLLEDHRRQLAALRERWTGRGVELSQLVVEGQPDERLPMVAAELGAELIVVGSHGRTGLQRFLIGSVAERVTRRADVSVLVARGEAPDGGYRRVVIGTDFGELAERAIRRAVPLIARGGRIELVHCWQMPWAGTAGEPVVVAPHQELSDGLELALRQAADKARAMLGDRPDLELAHTLTAMPPAGGLVELAATRKADLVVVGSHGRRGLRRFILGSVAEVTVRHAPCSVLVAR